LRSSLNEHIKSHAATRFVCPFVSCALDFATKQILDRHVRARHAAAEARSRRKAYKLPELVEIDDQIADEVRIDKTRLRGPKGQHSVTYGESMPLGTELILAICRVYYRLEQVILVDLGSGTVPSLTREPRDLLST
jgi:hypothetical protein